MLQLGRATDSIYAISSRLRALPSEGVTVMQMQIDSGFPIIVGLPLI